MSIETNAFESQRKIQLVQEVLALQGDNAKHNAIIEENNREITWRLADIREIYDKRHTNELLASGYPKSDSPLDYQPTLPGFGQVTQGIIRGFRSKLVNWRNVGIL